MTELFRAQLPRDESCEALGRRLLERHLGDARFDATVVSSAKLVVSEFLSNALQHGRGAIELVASLGDKRLRIEVTDQGEGVASEVRVGDGDRMKGGWGLEIVDGLALDWGAFDGSTRVWAEFALEE